MKKQTDLPPALRAMTTKEYDALWPKPPAPQGIRPLTPMVPCGECERLKAENEVLRAIVDCADEYLSEWRADKQLVIWNRYHELQREAREMGVID